jgi:hypothetical protein
MIELQSKALVVLFQVLGAFRISFVLRFFVAQEAVLVLAPESAI